MSENYIYSRPYGEAAFKLAVEDKSIENWSTQLSGLSTIVSDPQTIVILSDPKIDNAMSLKFLSSFLDDFSNNLKPNEIVKNEIADSITAIKSNNSIHVSDKVSAMNLDTFPVDSNWLTSHDLIRDTKILSNNSVPNSLQDELKTISNKKNISFLKNIGLAGGFILVAVNGPKNWAIESKKKYVRL